MRTRWTVVLLLAACALSVSAQKVKIEGKLGKEILLFNGKDFCGWTYLLADPNVKMEDVWSIDGDRVFLSARADPLVISARWQTSPTIS
jgi:hypothetical protein